MIGMPSFGYRSKLGLTKVIIPRAIGYGTLRTVKIPGCRKTESVVVGLDPRERALQLGALTILGARTG